MQLGFFAASSTGTTPVLLAATKQLQPRIIMDSALNIWQRDQVKPGPELTTVPTYGQRPLGSTVAHYSTYRPSNLFELELVAFPEFLTLGELAVWERLRQELLGQHCAEWLVNQQSKQPLPAEWSSYKYVAFPATVWLDRDDDDVRLPLLRFDSGRRHWKLILQKFPPRGLCEVARLRLRR